jgi:tetratricopeptide (TPR) repeat protein
MICPRLLVLAVLVTTLAACAPAHLPTNEVAKTDNNEVEADLSCSYFYFLWGSHAEIGGRYAEAHEAYEKALICDPNVAYIREKIPVLLLKMGEFDKAVAWLRQALVEKPHENNHRLFLAGLYIQQDKLPEAIALYEEALEREPDNETIHLRLGQLYSHRQQYDKAEKIFRRQLKNNEQSYFTRLALARLLHRTKKEDDAANEYEKALQLNWSKEVAYEVGYFYSGRKRHSEALRHFTAITDSDPFDERAALTRVQSLLDHGDNALALESLEKIAGFSKNQANIELIMAKVLLRMEKVNEAKNLLERLAAEEDGSEARYTLALLAYREKEIRVALSHLAAIPPHRPEFEDAAMLQVRILSDNKEQDKAISLLRKHLAKKENRRPALYSLLAALYQENNEAPAALSLMEAGTTLYPDNIQMNYDYGVFLDKNGMEEQALRRMERVLELQPEHADALNFIGYAWADKNIRLPEALQYIVKALALDPDNGYIVDSLGWVYFRLGDFTRAVKELRRALELEASDPHIHDHLGDALRAVGDKTQAVVHYRQAVEMFSDDKKKTATRKKLDDLEQQ